MKTLFLAFLLLLVELAPPTVLSEKDIKTTSFNKKNQGSKAPKKVFIRSFNALFEVYEEASAKTSSRRSDRADRTTFTSGTMTKMGVQIAGVDVDDFQKIINDAYATYVKQLTSQGFEIMSADEASKYEYFAEWTKVKGGASSDAQAAGYVMVTPVGFEYLVKKISASGKQKMGGGLLDNTPKMSKEMDNVFIADVNFVFPFVNLDADSDTWTNSTSVKAKIDYRIEPIVDPTENKASLGGGPNLLSQVSFMSGLDIGNNPLFHAKVEPKKAVSFEGVFKDKKIRETTSAQSDMFSKAGYSQLVMTSGEQRTVASHFAECNKEAYINAASGTINDLIEAGLANFQEMTKD
ncbi:MAG: hypothetical protein EP311_09285 [Cytophagales bacterium]|uniref:Uncharacterized protein n=1 Tax=Algoriphagus taiwanensis TaxID=1445656 RepID=A0ABQ6Q212_9BACT|nr:MAG: hypothetical protein EP311_09285 [Cytophagales bacterium]GMQ34113.1 hypothetical protein Ataiwa_23850 [Algoriphagus taiwanensis]